ncbi:hypothetical protein EIKCOROL_02125 [Eikenella corrodens ATCC 23834]|uniref:Uncharacterized protein n=1 Tax=Eikenella corrodens ATCC 23834 TaxID=546274 RepID=C0DXL4_EIKCO|nr:hypothetical protein EIKCOROL_02125 [Eikenella corrodens ATCC 23834]
MACYKRLPENKLSELSGSLFAARIQRIHCGNTNSCHSSLPTISL